MNQTPFPKMDPVLEDQGHGQDFRARYGRPPDDSAPLGLPLALDDLEWARALARDATL